MATRFPSGRDCVKCPTPAQTAINKAIAKAPMQVLTSAGESERLWKHVLYGTGTVVGLIHGYAKAGLPGDPRDGIKALIAVLNDALVALDERAGNETEASGSEPTVDPSAGVDG